MPVLCSTVAVHHHGNARGAFPQDRFMMPIFYLSRHLPGLAVVLVLVLAGGSVSAQQEDLRVVVTSKPIHSLVASVMKDVGTPALLVDGTASPHTYAMRPSDAQKVQRAHVFFRVSEALEPFTARVVKALPKSVKVTTLAEAVGVKLLERRAGGAFDAHEHDTGQKGHGHKDHAHGALSPYDAHIWLDPDNAKAMAGAIVSALSAARPDLASRFAANAAALTQRIDDMAVAISRDLKPVAGKPFVVLHDAYQYFERRFGLEAIGSIQVDPDEQPSAKRITDLRRKVGALPAVCVFAEPNHQPKVVATVTEGTRARTAVLDPEGAMIDAGPELYVGLMQRLATGMKSCLSQSQ
jgi:zinc transport system substrate-binding protein